jgi:hypothetical protein
VIGRVSFMTVDATDPGRLAAFWGEVLGTEVAETSDAGRFVFLGEANGHVLSFQRVPEPKSVKNRVHLDIASRISRWQRMPCSPWAGPGTGKSFDSTTHDGDR